MAELRKANQLWPSDPIHLRKVLYIPLYKAHKAKHLVLEHLDTMSKATSETYSLDTTIESTDRSGNLSSPSSTPFIIRRLPSSQLSFFPPSSSRLRDPSSPLPFATHTLPRTQRVRDSIPLNPPSSSPSVYSDSPSASHSLSAFAAALQRQSNANESPGRSHIATLTSLLGSFPLGRLSFESGTSTPTQASDEQEHELTVVESPVKAGGISVPTHRMRNGQQDKSPPASLGRLHANSEVSELDAYASASLSQTSLPRGRDKSRSASRSAPRQIGSVAYTPEHNTLALETVRTSQLEPSPVMQLPLKPRRERAVDS